MPVLPLYAKALGATLAATGTVVAMRGLGNLVADAPAGMLVARLPRRAIMVATLAAEAVIAAAMGLVGDITSLAALMFLAGGVEALFFLTRLDHVRWAAPQDQRGRAMALLGGVNRIGLFVGPVAGGFLGRAYGLHVPFFGRAAFVAAAIAFVAATMRESEAGRPPALASEGLLRSLWRTLVEHRRSFSTVGPAILALSLLRAGRSILIPLWGNDIGLDVAAIGLVMGLSSAADMTLFYPAGLIMDRLGRKWAALPCLLVLAASLALVPATGSFVGLLLVGLLAGVGNGLGSGINMTLSADLAPDRGSGQFLGIWRLVGDVGTASGPFLVGFVAQTVALGPAALVVAAFGVAGAFVVLRLVPETLTRGRFRGRHV